MPRLGAILIAGMLCVVALTQTSRAQEVGDLGARLFEAYDQALHGLLVINTISPGATRSLAGPLPRPRASARAWCEPRREDALRRVVQGRC